MTDTKEMLWVINDAYAHIFFFQAEDGIRDIGVTGVQTCALPIFPRALQLALVGAALRALAGGAGLDLGVRGARTQDGLSRLRPGARGLHLGGLRADRKSVV